MGSPATNAPACGTPAQHRSESDAVEEAEEIGGTEGSPHDDNAMTATKHPVYLPSFALERYIKFSNRSSPQSRWRVFC
jgi:hypothetical protein